MLERLEVFEKPEVLEILEMLVLEVLVLEILY